MSDDDRDNDATRDAPQTAAPLREATDAEEALITRLSTAVGHRLLRDWEELPQSAKVLTMNRAFLAAMAHAMGSFMAAVAANDPVNVEGWTYLLDQVLAIAHQTALEKRELVLAALQPGGSPAAPEAEVRRRVLVPEPPRVM